KGVTATGPATPVFADNKRLLSVGILIGNTICAGGDSQVKNNEISNVAMGIQLSDAQCVKVMDNDIHNNASVTNNTPGILLLSSSNNTIKKNFVHANGSNFAPNASNPAGAVQMMNGAVGNDIVNNTVVNNCTNGISAFDGPPVPAGSTLGNTI